MDGYSFMKTGLICKGERRNDISLIVINFSQLYFVIRQLPVW